MFFIQSLKLILVGIVLISFFTITIILYPLFKLRPDLIRRFVIRVLQYHARLLLTILGITTTVKTKLSKRRGQLIISNHLSYVDILVILARYETSFITSYEMKEVPFLGQICELAGCFFTERRHKKNLVNEVQGVKDVLGKGFSITFFPEATSTDGTEIKRFRKPFFYPAQESGIDITSLVINYKMIDGNMFNVENRDLICWYGDMTFFSHFWKLLSCRDILVELDELVIDVKGSIEETVLYCEQMTRDRFCTV